MQKHLAGLSMKLEKAFARVLRDLRLKQEMSQEKLAFASNLDRTYISLLERGLRQPTLSTIFQLARELDITPTHLVAAVETRAKKRS